MSAPQTGVFALEPRRARPEARFDLLVALAVAAAAGAAYLWVVIVSGSCLV